MSPPAPVQLTGTKRRAATAATNNAAAAAGSPGFQTPGPKRQALGQSSVVPAGAADTGGAADTAAAAAAVPSILPLSPVPIAITPAHTNTVRRGGSSSSSRSVSRTPGPVGTNSDAEYLLNLAVQQQQQQQTPGLFHTQTLPLTPYNQQGAGQVSGTSRLAGNAPAAANAPLAGFNSTPSPGSGSGFSAILPEVPPAGAFGSSAGTAATPGQPAVASPAAEAYKQPGSNSSSSSRLNPLLSHLPSRQSGKSGTGLQRRLSGGVDMPHRMTPIAEAVAEPKPLPLHVQVAARDVMTGRFML